MFDLDSYFDDLKEKQTVVSYNGEKSLLSTSVEPGKRSNDTLHIGWIYRGRSLK